MSKRKHSQNKSKGSTRILLDTCTKNKHSNKTLKGKYPKLYVNNLGAKTTKGVDNVKIHFDAVQTMPTEFTPQGNGASPISFFNNSIKIE